MKFDGCLAVFHVAHSHRLDTVNVNIMLVMAKMYCTARFTLFLCYLLKGLLSVIMHVVLNAVLNLKGPQSLHYCLHFNSQSVHCCTALRTVPPGTKVFLYS